MTNKHLTVLFVPLLALGACTSRQDATEGARATSSIEVAVAPVAVRELSQSFEAGGVIRARTTASITSRIVAEVREVRVRAGDRVRRGQPLVTLDARDLTAASAGAAATARAAAEGQTAALAEQQSAEATAVLARATYARISTLHTKNSATPQELDQASSALQSAEARVRSAGARVAEAEAAVDAARAAGEAASVTASFAVLTAPFDGVITAKLVEPGNMASPGVPLLILEDTTTFRLEVRVDETRAALIQPGAHAVVELADDARGTAPASLAGSVAEVAQALDADAHAFLVKIDLPAGAPVRSGMFGRARFPEGRRQGLAVPAGGVVQRGQLTIVFVVDRDGRARMRPIRVGARSDDGVEVLAGLDAGERIVVDPPASLTDGMMVREGARR